MLVTQVDLWAQAAARYPVSKRAFTGMPGLQVRAIATKTFRYDETLHGAAPEVWPRTSRIKVISMSH